MNYLLMLAMEIFCVLFATSLHEFVRAATSTALGDKKPKSDGRLTLNPLKHFEPIGFILCWATGFGWGKPVQTNAMFYKNRKRDTLITAVMPSVANLFVAALFGMLIRIMGSSNAVIYYLLASLVKFNVTLAVYNLVPVTPMDGLKVLSSVMPANTYFKYIQYEKMVQMIFLLVMFMGYTNIIFDPIIKTIMLLFGV